MKNYKKNNYKEYCKRNIQKKLILCEDEILTKFDSDSFFDSTLGYFTVADTLRLRHMYSDIFPSNVTESFINLELLKNNEISFNKKFEEGIHQLINLEE